MITDLEKVTLLHTASLLESQLNMTSYARTIRALVAREKPDARHNCPECNGAAAVQRAFGGLAPAMGQLAQIEMALLALPGITRESFNIVQIRDTWLIRIRAWQYEECVAACNEVRHVGQVFEFVRLCVVCGNDSAFGCIEEKRCGFSL